MVRRRKGQRGRHTTSRSRFTPSHAADGVGFFTVTPESLAAIAVMTDARIGKPRYRPNYGQLDVEG